MTAYFFARYRYDYDCIVIVSSVDPGSTIPGFSVVVSGSEAGAELGFSAGDFFGVEDFFGAAFFAAAFFGAAFFAAFLGAAFFGADFAAFLGIAAFLAAFFGAAFFTAAFFGAAAFLAAFFGAAFLAAFLGEAFLAGCFLLAIRVVNFLVRNDN